MSHKITFFAMLLASVVLLVPLSDEAYGKTEYDSILRIATHAFDEINAQLSRTDNVSASVEDLLDEGMGELKALREAAQKDDSTAAKQHFLSAMNIFKHISQMLSSEAQDSSIHEGGRVTLDNYVPAETDLAGNLEQAEEEHLAGDLEQTERHIAGDLERTERYLASLKNIARTHDAKVDFSEVDALFPQCRQHIEENDHNAAQMSIDRINQLTAEISSKLQESAQVKASDRAKQFAQKYLDRLDAIISQAEELGYDSETVEKLKDAKDRLTQSSDPREIIDEVKRILAITSQFGSESERVILEADRIKETVDELSLTEGIDTAEIQKITDMLSELRSLVDEDRIDDARSLLGVIRGLLVVLQDSV